MARKHALNIAEEECYQHIAILSESKSAISSVNKITTNTNNTISQILEIHADLTNKGKRIRLICVPSHIGITGNEQANKAAKEVITDPTSMEYANSHFKDLISFIRTKLTTKWELEWNNSAPLHIKVLTDSSIIPTKNIKNLTRREQVAISRLKIGQTMVFSSLRGEGCCAQATPNHTYYTHDVYIIHITLRSRRF